MQQPRRQWSILCRRVSIKTRPHVHSCQVIFLNWNHTHASKVPHPLFVVLDPFQGFKSSSEKSKPGVWVCTGLRVRVLSKYEFLNYRSHTSDRPGRRPKSTQGKLIRQVHCQNSPTWLQHEAHLPSFGVATSIYISQKDSQTLFWAGENVVHSTSRGKHFRHLFFPRWSRRQRKPTKKVNISASFRTLDALCVSDYLLPDMLIV